MADVSGAGVVCTSYDLARMSAPTGRQIVPQRARQPPEEPLGDIEKLVDRAKSICNNDVWDNSGTYAHIREPMRLLLSSLLSL